MIKVQPARSRMVKTDTPDRLTLRMPPKGVAGLGGLLLLGSLLWFATTSFLVVQSLRHGQHAFAVFGIVAALPGVVMFFAGIADAMRTWSVERDSAWVTLRSRGLLGAKEQRWPATDVASVYPQSAPGGEHDAWLAMGLRNGRSVSVVRDDYEEIAWVAAMLREPRGTRKVAAPLQQAAEPERRRADPAIVPTTLTARTFEGGVEIAFHPLLRSGGLWWKLPLAALVAVVALIAVAVILHVLVKAVVLTVLTRVLIVAILGGVGWRMWTLNRSGVVQVMDGIVTVVQNHGEKPQQFGVVDVEFVQTFRAGRHTELQFLLKGQPKVRGLADRPAPELEWAARFLRVAIKGRPAVPESAALKVDATAGECQVCLERMDSRVVYCGKCRTPSHEECWSYIGMCSTYGCREIRFERK